MNLWNFDDEAISDICTALLKEDYIAAIKVLNENNQVVFENWKTNKNNFILMYNDIKYSDKRIGTIQVAFSMNRLHQLKVHITQITILTVLSISLSSILILNFLIRRYLSYPLDLLNKDIKRMTRGEHNLSMISKQKMEIQQIIDAFNDLNVKLMTSEKEVTRKTMALEELNTDLTNRVEIEIKKRLDQEQLLIQQSKLASMGEMIGLITHQWRQPLNAIALNVQDLKDSYEYGELDEKYMNNSFVVTMNQIEFMTKTLEDFKNFLIPSKKKVQFDIKSNIEELILLFEHVFKKTDIDISINIVQGTVLLTEGYPNEFKQVLLNILINSKDAIISRRFTETELHGLIEINIGNNTEKDRIIVSIKDNGGGIADHIIDKIFDRYYTTKEKEGTGVGLYMSKTIIETNMGGSLTVRNIDGKAEFLITLGLIKSDILIVG
ncbi:MAG: hypothetical protein HQK92_06200 [Nitrospirae bacterium]|nr:hypothetical protein [Nitrospirota bacterium]